MSLEMFMLMLMITSTMTSLFTEAVKMVMDECKKTYHANVLAGVIALIVSVLVGVAYIVLNNAALTAQLGVYLVSLVLCSWLCAMVGYDKVMQAISQFAK